VDLARRAGLPDDTPDEGGKIEVLAKDIDLFELEYLDPASGRWREEWDSTSVVGEKGRIPFQVKIKLVLNGGRRALAGSSQGKIRLVTIVDIPIRDPLHFALQ
ncbi:MAG: general secretion pathway protein GspJ, partial [Polyangiaceae bacterium]|nr:general secretion pathway protein GspJ [Polyangiaceae bacterium]